jgi:hypothetical protein
MVEKMNNNKLEYPANHWNQEIDPGKLCLNMKSLP